MDSKLQEETFLKLTKSLETDVMEIHVNHELVAMLPRSSVRSTLLSRIIDDLLKRYSS